MNNSLSAWQCLLAAIFGVAIGLMLSRTYHRELAVQPAAPLQVAQTAFTDALSKVKLVPTLDSPMTLLVMGVDSNGLKASRFTNTRSDTMMVVCLNPQTRRVGVVSIPRDSRVRLAGNHGVDKINAAHALGGPQLSLQTVKEAFLVPVDHYVVIDTQGLRKLFQLLGPVHIMVEKRLRYTDHAGHLHIALNQGLNTLSPEQAEEYVRFRHDAQGDIGRIDRQQWFLRQVAMEKLRDPSVIMHLPEIIGLAKDYVVTDLTPEDMTKMVTFAKDMQPSQIETAMLPGQSATIHGGSYWLPDFAADATVLTRVLGIPCHSGQQPEEAQTGSANSALAAEDNSSDKPLRIIIKYPKGCEKTSQAFENALTANGYNVTYRMRVDAADCAHEQIVQTSLRADDVLTDRLRQQLKPLADWPVVVKPESRAPSDFTIILNHDSSPPQLVNEKPKE